MRASPTTGKGCAIHSSPVERHFRNGLTSKSGICIQPLSLPLITCYLFTYSIQYTCPSRFLTQSSTPCTPSPTASSAGTCCSAGPRRRSPWRPWQPGPSRTPAPRWRWSSRRRWRQSRWSWRPAEPRPSAGRSGRWAARRSGSRRGSGRRWAAGPAPCRSTCRRFSWL